MRRPDAKVKKCTSITSPSTSKSLSMASLLWSCCYQSSGVRPCAFRLSQQAMQLVEDIVLGAQLLLPLAQAPRIRTF